MSDFPILHALALVICSIVFFAFASEKKWGMALLFLALTVVNGAIIIYKIAFA